MGDSRIVVKISGLQPSVFEKKNDRWIKLIAAFRAMLRSDPLLSDLLSVPIRLFPHRPVLLRAFEMARKYSLTVHDTLYSALAEEHGAVIFSADNQLLKIAAHLHLQLE